MSKNTKAELQAENAELRERVKLLEAVVQRLVVAPTAPQMFPLPCPGPHYPPSSPTVPPYIPSVPQMPWPYGTTIVCGGEQRPLEGVHYTFNDAVRPANPFFGTLTSVQIPPLHANNACCAPTMLGNVWNLGTH